jgi:hypothetical protein
VYHVIVTDSRKRIMAEALREGLADAVAYGRRKSQEGNLIRVFDALQDASGEIVHISKVLTVVHLKEVT